MSLIEGRLTEINSRHNTAYRSVVVYLTATDFGVPQHRERAFLVAFRDGEVFRPPVPVVDEGGHNPVPSAWDALKDIAPSDDELAILAMRGKWAELLPSIPEGQNYLWHTERGGGLPLFGWRTRYWSFLLKLAKHLPSWTIQADPGPATGPFHWNNRLLSIREMARLQSFPENYEFVGDYRSARRQVGNAVPPALAEAVAKRVASVLRGTAYDPHLCLAIKGTGTSPPPEDLAEVPDRYRFLEGHHEAHPGTGKGPAALARVSSA